MKRSELQAKLPELHWQNTVPLDIGYAYDNRDDDQKLVERFQPVLCGPANLSLMMNGIMTEATYKEIGSLIDFQFLQHKVRRDALEGVEFTEIDDTGTMHFKVKSSEFDKNGTRYDVLIKFLEWDEIGQDSGLSWLEKARLLLWAGNIQLYCSDPSFLYYGFQYLLSQINASLYPENRQPRIRNPQERGIVSKHASKVLTVLPFYSGKIAHSLKQQFG